jgi:glutathione S-transferase
MKLYGTRTSPFVRRVRIVADMVGAEVELVDTAVEDGQLALRTLTPIWKIPVLEDGDKAIFDSRVINDYLIRRYGNRHVRTDSGVGRWRETNLVTVIDGALDSAINAFYLVNDGAKVDQLAYLAKQRARVQSAMDWIEKQLDGPYLTDVPRIGLSEIALTTALDWMRFRKTYPVDDHVGLSDFLRAHRDFPPFASTWPPP